jgi:protein TonB
MLLRAAAYAEEKSFSFIDRSILFFLAIAALCHLGFFFAWEKTGFTRPYETSEINLDALGIPLEIVLELSGPLERANPSAEGGPMGEMEDSDALLEAPPLPPDSDDVQEEPPLGLSEEIPIPPDNDSVLEEEEEPYQTFPLSRSAPLFGGEDASANPFQGPDSSVKVEESAPAAKSYDVSIRTAVARHWILPPEARNNFQPARFTASMTLDPMGRIVVIMVEESSGNSVLDHAAMEALRGAAPYEPFPENLKDLDQMTFRLHFDYKAVMKRSMPERKQ